METRQLISFLRIARLGSFSRAAQELGYSQSALTVQIRLLEQELGTRLFDRIGRQVTLTSAGEHFHVHANRIIQEMQTAVAAANDTGELDGLLRIGTIESLCFSRLPQILGYFRSHHPRVRLQLITGSPEELIEKMERSQVDLIYFLDRPLHQNNWVKVLEEQEDIVFVCSPSFPLTSWQSGWTDSGTGGELTHRPGLRLRNLLDFPFLLTEKDANYRYELDQHLASQGLEILPFLEISNTEFIIRQVSQGLGLSFLPHFAVKDRVDSGELQILNVEDFHMSMSRQLFYHRDKWVTPEMEVFLGQVRGEERA